MSDAPPPENFTPTPFVSRFPTRIHRLTVPIGETTETRTIDLLAPVDPDALLDDPDTLQRYRADDYLPYWPIIWPSGLMLASRILSESSSPPAAPLEDARCIELGCGLGSTGIAAGLRGWHVTFTDYDPEAVHFAAHNAQRNGIPPDRIRALHMDWRDPVQETFPWVIASDVLYERRLHPLLLSAIAKLLTPVGQAWVSDPNRTAAEDFPLLAVEQGFKVRTHNLEGESFAGGKQRGQLFILTRRP
ncbi:MAG TPA: methyltransferase [Phycisphaerae bacterium]|nr:methyltransferase [Phycisphaerae bacterium]